ncbi:MAG: SDR family oxidoreductase [Candidatus Binataceae bacterium]|nr:SDR family oxidoreductase [Candidatus Binataceae bacterium]
MARFSDQVAIVTGAAGGIGLGIARRLASEGAAIMIGDLSDNARAVAGEVAKTFGVRTLCAVGDLGQPGVAEKMVAETEQAFGRIDILVNNAGGGILRPSLEHTEETLQATINRNLWTMLRATLAVIPRMKKRGYGRIVNMGADSVYTGLDLHTIYNGAKGGVHGATVGFARELAVEGITINAVAPCGVETEEVKRAAAENHPLIVSMMQMIPMRRMAKIEDVAAAVAFLASSEAGFITGQILSVNGGTAMG